LKLFFKKFVQNLYYCRYYVIEDILIAFELKPMFSMNKSKYNKQPLIIGNPLFYSDLIERYITTNPKPTPNLTLTPQ